MKKLIKSKSGVTLAEIVVVLAVVAVMSVMVSSFSIMCSGWTKRGINRHKMLSSFTFAEAGIRNFVTQYDDDEHVFVVDGDALIVTDINAPDKSYSITFADDALRVYADGGDFAYPTENIVGISFALLKSSLSESVILRANITYLIPPLNDRLEPEEGFYNVAIAIRAASKSETGG